MIKGSTRYVFIFKNIVIKIPSFYNYERFLNGLLANLNEVKFSKCIDFKEKICPIIFHIPFGFLIIMPKCRILNKNEISKKDLIKFCKLVDGCKIPAEIKFDSFGYLNGNLVAVDYN